MQTALREKRRRSRGPAKRERIVTGVVTRGPRSEFSQERWHDMVATAAYYVAEARGFEGGSPDEDWYEAEAQLREQLAAAEADEKEEVGLDLTAHHVAAE